MEAIDSRQIERLAIVHVRPEPEAEEFFQHFCESINYPGEVLYAELNPGLSVDSGSGMVGACFVVSD